MLNRRLNQRDLDLAFISNVEPGDAVRSELLGAQDIASLRASGRDRCRRDLPAISANRMFAPRDKQV